MADSMHPIRKYRRAQTPRMPLRQLAADVGISKVSLSRIETGKQALTPELAMKFAVRTGIPARVLCPELAALFDQACGSEARQCP